MYSCLRRARKCHGPQGAAAKTFPQHTYYLLLAYTGDVSDSRLREYYNMKRGTPQGVQQG